METDNNLRTADKQLVKSILDGDRNGFPQLIANTQALVAQMVFRMIPHPPDRADIAQDIYLKVFKSLPNFRFQSKLSTWIGQITFNTCMHYLEKKRPSLAQTESQAEDQPDEDQNQSENEIWNNPSERLLEAKQLSNLLALEISYLSSVQQLVLNLYHMQELSLQEICQITSMNDSTVRSHLFRARKQLKTQLTSKYRPEDL